MQPSSPSPPNPYKSVNRPHYMDDVKYQEFDKLITSQSITYDALIEFVQIPDIVAVASEPAAECIQHIDPKVSAVKQEWLERALKWLITSSNKEHNQEAKTNPTNPQVPIFAAIALLFSVLPYNKIGSKTTKKLFNQVIGKQINIAVFYEFQSYRSLPFEDDEDLFGGPLYPPAYVQWLSERYNRACWNLCYYVYECRNNLPHIWDKETDRAKLKV